MKNVNKEDVMSKAMMAYVANDHYYYPSAGMSVTACRVKRVADVIVSLIALIIFSPVFLLISWLIKHEDGGIIRKSKFPQNPKRSVRFSGKGTKRSVQKRKARNTQKAETKVL